MGTLEYARIDKHNFVDFSRKPMVLRVSNFQKLPKHGGDFQLKIIKTPAEPSIETNFSPGF